MLACARSPCVFVTKKKKSARRMASTTSNTDDTSKRQQHVCVCVRVCVCLCVRACVRTYHNEKKKPDKSQAQVTTVILQVSSRKHKAKKSAARVYLCACVRACIVCVCHYEKKKCQTNGKHDKGYDDTSNKMAGRHGAPRPSMTDVGTETAFRLEKRKHFRKSKHLFEVIGQLMRSSPASIYMYYNE